MIDRRTFLKLSAGALVLTAAGALTGCGGMNDRPKVTIDGVVFMCEAPVITGGSGYAVRYCPLFAIQNDTGERVYWSRKILLAPLRIWKIMCIHWNLFAMN